MDNNLSEIEKANAERDKALKSVSDLEQEVKAMELKTGLAEKGTTGAGIRRYIARHPARSGIAALIPLQ